MMQADIEIWALARAHTIVLNEGLNLAKAAQDLDRKRSRSLVYELRKVITAAILEGHAASAHPDAMRIDGEIGSGLPRKQLAGPTPSLAISGT